MHRLNIVCPYRAREAHLQLFLRGISLYFARDKADSKIPYRVLIVEQEDGLPFNSGMLKNIGFVLGRGQSDYTCFHDVDYLPVWADYSWPAGPVAILWHGAESRPFRVGGDRRIVRHDVENIFGGVVLVRNADFSAVNGFANSYWGWGYEDTDFRNRFLMMGSDIGRRKGTFEALDHDSHGYGDDGGPSEASLINARVFQSRWPPPPVPLPPDGLSTLKFQILRRCRLMENVRLERAATFERVTVRLNV